MDTETVSRNRPISESWTQEQHEGLIEFLIEEKEDMSEMAYAQEYLAIAIKSCACIIVRLAQTI